MAAKMQDSRAREMRELEEKYMFRLETESATMGEWTGSSIDVQVPWLHAGICEANSLRMSCSGGCWQASLQDPIPHGSTSEMQEHVDRYMRRLRPKDTGLSWRLLILVPRARSTLLDQKLKEKDAALRGLEMQLEARAREIKSWQVEVTRR